MAFESYIVIDGIKGESRDAKHKDHISVLSFGFSINQGAGGGASGISGRTGGRADVSEFNFTHLMDSSTPALALHALNGKHIPNIVLECCQAAGDKHTYLKYTLSDSVISSVNPTGNTKDEYHRPVHAVGIRFNKIKSEYTVVTDDGKKGGTFSFGWDLAADKSL